MARAKARVRSVGSLILHHRHDGVDAAGQDDAARAGRGLGVDGVVVPADAQHQQVEQRHRDHHDLGAVDELRDQDEDEDDGWSPTAPVRLIACDRRIARRRAGVAARRGAPGSSAAPCRPG